MRLLLIILVGLSFFSCQEQMGSSQEKEFEQILNNGNWSLISSDYDYVRFQSGLKFSEDHQLFDIDSQGKIVTSMHPRLFSISKDTMTVVDHRYEENFLLSRGTAYFLIEEIDEERLVLKVLPPEKENRLVFEKAK